jgi:hypothetical protein
MNLRPIFIRIEAQLHALAERIKALEAQQAKPPASDEPTKRGPGRPRKDRDVGQAPGGD